MINYIRNKKGFTLVEIIVVLVIIAILAATTLPALTGYINDARDKTAIAEGRTVLVAAQTIASEMKGNNVVATAIQNQIMKVASALDTKYPYINKLTGLKLEDDPSPLTSVTLGTAENETGTVVSFNFVASNGKKVKYTLADGLAIDTTTTGS